MEAWFTNLIAEFRIINPVVFAIAGLLIIGLIFDMFIPMRRNED